MPEFHPNHVRSEDLTLASVPDPEHATEQELWAFVHSFHAYTFWGGKEQAQAARKQVPGYKLVKIQKLDWLRTNLFLDQEHARVHMDLRETLPSDPIWVAIRAGLAELRAILKGDPVQ